MCIIIIASLFFSFLLFWKYNINQVGQTKTVAIWSVEDGGVRTRESISKPHVVAITVPIFHWRPLEEWGL